MMKRFNIYIICVLAYLSSCKEPYLPEVSNMSRDILVVEGFINTGLDSTIIKLSRSVVVDNKNTPNPEIGAVVSIETEANQVFSLSEQGKGMYAAPGLNLGKSSRYRLRIKTKRGGEYVSDFVEALISPPIDSVNYTLKTDGLDIFVNTHDATNNSHYYRWEYEESWVFYAKYNSQFAWRGGTTVTPREPHENIYQCWGDSKSNIIITGNSSKLDKDVISRQPIISIPSTSEKVSDKYSILVKQYTLSKEAYDFWEILKKNTESLGSIFDVLPSELTGNIRNITNANEPVLGYISAGTIQKQRIFISKDKFPTWRVKYPYNCIEPDTAFFWRMPGHFSGNLRIPIDLVTLDNGQILGYRSAQPECVDCTIRGTTRRPIFWQ